MHLNLSVLPRISSAADAVVLALFPGQQYTDRDRILRLHLFHPKEMRFIYLHESSVAPCSEDPDSPVTHHERLDGFSLHDQVSVHFEGRNYSVVRRLEASLEFMKEVNPHHFRLALDENMATPLSMAR